MPFYIMPDQEKLFVRRVGEGKPVLVLSGLGMQSWQWLPFLFASRKKYEFIIPDWRGFGGSKDCAIPETDAISSHWNDVDTLIKQLKLEQFILIGYSMGARPMQRLIQEHLKKPLAEMILFGELAEHGGNVAVSVKTEDGKEVGLKLEVFEDHINPSAEPA